MKNINEIQRRFKQNAKDEQQTPDRIIQASAGSKGSSGSGGGLVRSAKIIAIAETYFTVKLLDSAGNVETTSFLVYPLILNTANLASSSFPRLAVNYIIQVYKDFADSTTWKTDLIFDKIINVNNFY